MHVYILESDANNYQNLGLVNEEQDWEVIYRFNGISQGESWEPLKVEVYVEERNRDLPEGDFPALFGSLPILSGRAIKSLEAILKGNGEILALECKEGDYVAFNVTNVIDALNVERSEIVYFASGKVLDIKHFCFNASAIPANGLFKIPQMPLGRVFVTEEFVSIVQESELLGFLFTQVEVIKDDV